MDDTVHPDILQAESLPSRAFLDRDWLAREHDRVFAPSWVSVPWRAAHEEAADGRTLVDMMVRRGSQLPVMLHHTPTLLQRDWKGKLRAFPNVCTHASHTLVEGYGRERVIVCPQHGRRFNTEGQVVAHPGMEAHPRFPRACDHLTQWEADTWQSMVFVRQKASSVPLAAVLAPLIESTALLPWEKAHRASGGRERRDVGGNWKLHAWNFLDHYHIAHVHKAPHGLADAIDMGSYHTEVYSDSVLQWAWAQRDEDGFPPDWLPERFREDRRVFALWWFIFPNLALNVYPWGISVNVWSPSADPAITSFQWHHIVFDEERYLHRDERWLSRQVDDEDVVALAEVQRGVASGHAPRGLFAPRHETAAHWFHHKVSALMG